MNPVYAMQPQFDNNACCLLSELHGQLQGYQAEGGRRLAGSYDPQPLGCNCNLSFPQPLSSPVSDLAWPWRSEQGVLLQASYTETELSSCSSTGSSPSTDTSDLESDLESVPRKTGCSLARLSSMGTPTAAGSAPESHNEHRLAMLSQCTVRCRSDPLSVRKYAILKKMQGWGLPRNNPAFAKWLLQLALLKGQQNGSINLPGNFTRECGAAVLANHGAQLVRSPSASSVLSTGAASAAVAKRGAKRGQVTGRHASGCSKIALPVAQLELPAHPRWQTSLASDATSSAEDNMLRQECVSRLTCLLMSFGVGFERLSMAKLVEFVNRAESVLYRSSPSREAYADWSSLPTRARLFLAWLVSRNNAAKRACKSGEDS